ncbi:MAG TPA: hypothetical protein VI408_12510 [Gaiellaceae bacterium]
MSGVAEGSDNGTVEITDAMIARRAFEISLTDDTATPEENWARAERELREEQARQG